MLLLDNALLRVLLGAVVALLVLWLALVVVLVVRRPRPGATTDAARLLPDLVRLIARLARDRSLPRGVRMRLWLLLTYLAIPVDLIPDFIPVIGYADDAIIATLVLRSTVKRAGPEALRQHWPGTPAGLSAVLRLANIEQSSSPTQQLVARPDAAGRRTDP